MANADYTLTNLNGASDEARNAVLVVGGTNSAIKNIIAPAVNKQYIVKNNTSGGYAIVIKTSSSTGVTIPNGAVLTVYCDGTEFYAASFSPTGGTVTGNLAITGTLGVTGATTLSSTLNVTGATTLAAATATTPSGGDNTTKVATTAFTTSAISAALQVVYPIGSIYTSTVSTNPNTLFGFGTWVAFGAGRVLIGNGGGYTAGATGGSADAVVVSHTHTASSAVTDPGHAHNVQLKYDNGSGDGYSVAAGAGTGSNLVLLSPGTNTATTGISVATTITSAGVSGTGANLQPYVVVYMWNRTV
jgi:hypothetical protein